MKLLPNTEQKQAINIYPNPVTKNNCHLNFSFLNTTALIIEISSLNGVKISEQTAHLNGNTVGDIAIILPNNISKGNYVISVKNKDLKIVHTQLITVN